MLTGAGYFGVLGTSLLLAPLLPRERPLRGFDAERHPPPPVLTGDGYSITIEGKGASVLLRDSDGVAVQRFSGYRIGRTDFATGTAATTRSQTGEQSLVVEYAPRSALPGVTVRGTFTPAGRVLRVAFDIDGADPDTMWSGMMLRGAIADEPPVETVYGVADWERDPRGGVPFEANGRFVYQQRLGDRPLSIVTRPGHQDWRTRTMLHLAGVPVSEGVFRAEAQVLLGGDSRAVVVEGITAERPLAAALSTDRAYNIWDTADEPLAVRAVAYNGADDSRDVRFTWTARDYDGEVVAERDIVYRVTARSTVDDDLAVPLPGRGMAFVELTVTAGEDEVYTRTNVAVLPPHEFVETAATSMFGMAADYLFGPPEERALLKRIGVRRSRHLHFSQEERREYGFRQHRVRNPPSLDAYDDDPTALRTYTREELDRAEAGGASHYELANEWNMAGGVGSGEGADRYVRKWLTTFRRALDARDSDMGLLPVALAGMDIAYARNMFEAGLADHTRALNIHPGRVNVTPDYVPAPGGEFWNFHGALKRARALMEEYDADDMELWLTEVYAPTRPNSRNHDTYRHAGENVVLSAAIAAAEGVTSMLWYQLYDNIKANPYGTNASDAEYHYGLMLRDLSPKPSLLAYANIAEQLDEATFVRWLSFRGESRRRGMHFRTPRGDLVLLWIRADGYRLNTGGDGSGSFYPAREPWIDPWQTKEHVVLPATGDRVVEIDAIGRRTRRAVTDGEARATLDGAPRLFYGLDVDALREDD
ncbi:hypothetical protein [Microbacterium marinilacus]|uniref:Glycoside hydrolase family 42 N-terminal domain-containing protein n=1 Tax=Microbacterium marinilacus TaxID=415209 RepID=A0ABP7BL88_9MICO|nr:hypothetical protein [Microbacterium marinilacus]MBY0689773.1 hypothetical protein [Microbacterium marinilacus]